MPYYGAGDYAYQAGDHGNYAAGSIGSFFGKALKTVGGLVGGLPGAALRGAGGLLAPTPAQNTPIPILPMPMGQVPTPKQRGRDVTKIGVSPLGTVGVAFRKHRHMNAGNAKAARRAIRRIKGVRHLLQSIERELPHQKPRFPHRGSPGVITRAEAARALRA